jgi:hypothetical protein
MNRFTALALMLLAAGTASAQQLTLPEKLVGKAVVLNADDPDYARAAVASAVKPAGQGGVSAALVVRITQDIPVYRMWNGPAKKDARGNTNRLGGWWSYDAPKGPVETYRSDYEICVSWNDLTWVASCTLRAGAVVAIGPGQSVSAETCGDPTGKESYPANAVGWQTFVATPWNRSTELACPPDTNDYAADPANISKSK